MMGIRDPFGFWLDFRFGFPLLNASSIFLSSGRACFCLWEAGCMVEAICYDRAAMKHTGAVNTPTGETFINATHVSDVSNYDIDIVLYLS